MRKFIHIRNLEKYNPKYKDRHLVWCKFHFSMLNDGNFETLCEVDKWRFLTFVMLEMLTKKPVLLDKNFLKRKGMCFKTRRLQSTIRQLSANGLVEIGSKSEVDRAEIRKEQKVGSVYNKELTKDSVTHTILEKNRVEKNRVEKKGKEFTPPNVEEIRNYCKERNNSIDPETFYNHYKSKGWKVGKTPMVNWKAAIITWERKDEQSTKRYDD